MKKYYSRPIRARFEPEYALVSYAHGYYMTRLLSPIRPLITSILCRRRSNKVTIARTTREKPNDDKGRASIQRNSPTAGQFAAATTIFTHFETSGGAIGKFHCGNY